MCVCVCACEGDLPRSWATTVVFAVTTVVFLWNYVMFVVAAVMFPGNYVMFVAITGMFLGTTVMFLASAVLCQATAPWSGLGYRDCFAFSM